MDYLNRLEQDNEPETWHDYKPSHFKRPMWLLKAATEVEVAWKRYDLIIKEEIFASETEYRKPRYERVTAARDTANEAAAHYSKMWERWSSEVIEVAG